MRSTRFALVAAAGETASAAGVTGWPAGTATNAVRRCFNDWIAVRRGGIGLSEEAEAMRQVKHWIQAHGFSARCPRTDRADDDRAPQAINQAGWRKPIDAAPGGADAASWWKWLLYPEVFNAEVCKGLSGGPRMALRILDERGHLARDGRHLKCRRSVGNVKMSFHVVRSSILDDAEE